MTTNKLLLSLLLLICCKTAICQEQLTPLKCNPLLAKRGNHTTVGGLRSDSTNTSINLPFVDDFSYSQKYPANSKYPDPALWIDSNVYINNSYAVNPPTVGVATFDGLDKYGHPYSSIPFITGWADALTSRPINLRSNTPADSIYFSFFYQPQGNGDAPQSYDSLIVQFKDTLGNWDKVWGDTGGLLRPFRQVMIPVTDLKYFHPGFQFRFMNYADLSGNNNNWNVDYVKMKVKRNISDTDLLDAAFQYNTQSILKNYTQMPWNQFYNYQSTELRDSFLLDLINNYEIETNNINYGNHAYNLANNALLFALAPSNRPSINMNPESTSSQKLGTFTIPDISNTDHDSASMTMETDITRLSTDGNSLNDTVYHDQFFYNYYSYDDGSAETAYSLLGNGEAPELAYKFNLNQPDTLRAVQIFFAWANAMDSNDIFDVQVWSSLSPEDTLYSDGVNYSKVAFGDSLTGDGFHTYRLTRPVAVSGSFYIGFLQTDLDPIYVGFDVNDNDSMNLYYNVGSGFQQSQFHGALMMRPVLGKPLPALVSGIAPLSSVNKGTLMLYPDPVKDILNIRLQDATISNADISIENILGQTVMNYNKQVGGTSSNDLEIDVSTLPPGMYFVHLADKKGDNALSAKFIKTN